MYYRSEVVDKVLMQVKNNTDLLVSYSWGCFHWARAEIMKILKQLGDPAPLVERTAVSGIAMVRTCLNNRTVIKHCKAIWQTPGSHDLQFAIKWVPVDYWCKTDLDAMKQVIDTSVKGQIKPDQTWRMVVKRRRYQKHHTIDIVRHLAQDVDRVVNLNEPDWIIWVDIIGRETAIALLKGDEVFSINKSQPT